MNMRELAKLANVTVSTVSKAFSGAYGVSEDTRQHIFSIARQTGCYGKFYKEKCPKPIIAIILPEMRSQFYVAFAEQLEEAIIHHGGIAWITMDGFDDDHLRSILDQFPNYLAVDGLIMFRQPHPEQIPADLPVVFIEESGQENGSGNIQINLEPAINEAVTLLSKLGHKRIAFLGEKSSRQKRQQFIQAVDRCGQFEKTWTITSGSHFEAAGVEGVHSLLDQTGSCTALVCAYNYVAIGAIKALQKAGYSVPEDISVIGMDNVSNNSYLLFPLTTIETDITAVSQAAVGLMWEKMCRPQSINVPPQMFNAKLQIRSTTSPAKKMK